MKVLWLCNTLIKDVNFSGNSKEKPESWLSGIYQQIVLRDKISLIYLYPSNETKIEEKEVGNSIFVNYEKDNENKLSCQQINQFKWMLERYRPDVIHIFGTECSHSLAMIMASEDLNVLDRVVVHVQGLISLCGRHYTAYLPNKVINNWSFRDIIRRNNLKKARKNFLIQGEFEKDVLQKVKHVVGRTDWDRAYVKKLNPTINYYHCNETMRKPFYKNVWSYEKCEKHTVFFSQWYAPLKGLHLVIEAMADLKKIYPDVHLYTTGRNLLDYSLKNKIRNSYYHNYCIKLIKQYGLENNITFLGYLDENAMCERFLKSNVFVSASSIENSPNSVGEAMLLGVPTVSSDVGGVKNLLTHNEEGFIYPADEPYMLAYYVSELFKNQELAEKFSKNSRKHARDLYNAETNIQRLFEIYDVVSGV